MSSSDGSFGNDLLPQIRTIRIPGDGRCLFRSIAHGACFRAGKPSPTESSIQRELADQLRDKVADEFIKRRAGTEWFLEGDFDTYVLQMRQPHIWGGEPELIMSSHVLKMPITVYMKDKNSGSLKIIAEYGQEYGKENSIRVLYHGYGHYDALQIPCGSPQSKLYDLYGSPILSQMWLVYTLWDLCHVRDRTLIPFSEASKVSINCTTKDDKAQEMFFSQPPRCGLCPQIDFIFLNPCSYGNLT